MKILSLNINNLQEKHGAWARRREMILDLLVQHEPDVIALQSAAVTNGGNQAGELAAAVEGSAVFFAELPAAGGFPPAGQAVITRLPAEHQVMPLSFQPGTEDPFLRQVLYTRFDLPDGPLHLFNAHLSWVEAQAAQNLVEAVAFISGFDGWRILTGDLNTPPGSAVFEPLRRAGWVDAWQYLRPEEDGYTFEQGRLFTRIDYAWLSPELAPHLAGIEVVGQAPGVEGEHISDHAGLLTTLDLRLPV